MLFLPWCENCRLNDGWHHAGKQFPPRYSRERHQDIDWHSQNNLFIKGWEAIRGQLFCRAFYLNAEVFSCLDYSTWICLINIVRYALCNCKDVNIGMGLGIGTRYSVGSLEVGNKILVWGHPCCPTYKDASPTSAFLTISPSISTVVDLFLHPLPQTDQQSWNGVCK